MISEEYLSLIDQLSQKDSRKYAFTKIAKYLGVDDILFFILDKDVDTFIPAPGMNVILPNSNEWQKFLRKCEQHEEYEYFLTWPGGRGNKNEFVYGVKSTSGVFENRKTCILVFKGKPHSSDMFRHLINLLPLVATCIRLEWIALKTKQNFKTQDLCAEKSVHLFNQLEQTRQDLQHSLYHSQLALNSRNEFLAIASHELKTPLTCIVLEVSLLRRSFEMMNLNESQTKMMGRISSLENQVKRMSTLVDNLLDYSQVVEGHWKYNHQNNDLTKLTYEVVQRFIKQARLSGSDIKFSADGPVMAICDRSRMDQVISNLISNAIKYGANNDIIVEIKNNNDASCIYVKDKGIGIADSDQSKIFNRFERTSRAKSYTGFGLGLFVVKKIIDAHKGTIHVESRPGEGSTFIIKLPQLECQELL